MMMDILKNTQKANGMKWMKFWMMSGLLLAAVGVFGQGWMRTYGGAGIQGLVTHAIKSGPTSDGGFLTVAFQEDGKPYLLRVSSNGDVVFEKNFSEDNFSIEVGAMTVLDNDEFILAGSAWNTSTDTVFSYCAKIDMDGDLIWSHTYDLPAPFGVSATAIVPAPNGGYTLAFNFGAGDPASTILMKLDENGDLEWTGGTPIAGLFGDHRSVAMVVCPDDTYAICGSFLPLMTLSAAHFYQA